MKKIRVGFIGQGYIGKNYADDFETRGYEVIRYAKEEPYIKNRDVIKTCEIVFVAVPTPTTKNGYDGSIIRSVLPLTETNTIVVLKSTILPGLTRIIQKEFPDRIIMHSPEFLSETTAANDAAHPFMNIVGIVENNDKHNEAARLVHSILPNAPFIKTVSSEEAELIKYAHNGSGYTQIIFFNLIYDLAIKLGSNWQNIEEALKADPFIPNRYASPIHKSGRGAGGHCFIKDMSALRQIYESITKDTKGVDILKSMEEKNKSLLTQSNKDIDLLKGVYE
ncbi:MAG: hypothetical protein AAB392_02500 [Patescibacteria group bacterium]